MISAGAATGEATVPEGVCVPGTWIPRSAILVTYADIIAGSQARQLTLPNMSVTVDLSLDVSDDDTPFARRVEEITLQSRVLRSGKRMVVTETLFSIPGIGQLLTQAVLSRDYPMVQGGLLLTTALLVLINIGVDTCYALLDPRVRYDG